jgi:hypothetical protein
MKLRTFNFRIFLLPSVPRTGTSEIRVIPNVDEYLRAENVLLKETRQTRSGLLLLYLRTY